MFMLGQRHVFLV